MRQRLQTNNRSVRKTDGFFPCPFKNATRRDDRFCYRANGALVRTTSYEDAADRVI
jgi:hypothetical protein